MPKIASDLRVHLQHEKLRIAGEIFLSATWLTKEKHPIAHLFTKGRVLTPRKLAERVWKDIFT